MFINSNKESDSEYEPNEFEDEIEPIASTSKLTSLSSNNNNNQPPPNLNKKQQSNNQIEINNNNNNINSNKNNNKSNDNLIIINGILTKPTELSGGRLKKFQCTFEGCDKCYTRPVRLEEHMRSHTGERPFKCPHCTSAFGRDSHLKAHVRTHANEEDKKYSCDECDKKFWTNQHLKKHIEIIHRGKTYDCIECEKTFKKHNLLRTHIAEVHSTPGTDPFQCDFPTCDKSFKQSVHLKAHQKTHDVSRYLCSHPTCLPLPLSTRQFPTWSALQKHHKLTHPPTCHYPECEGKTFTTNRGLKGHLEVHAEREEVEELEAGGVEDPGIKSKRKRGRGRKRKSEIGGGGGGGKKTKRSSNSEEETAEETMDDNGGLTTANEWEEGTDYEERMESERDERMEWDRNGKKRVKIDSGESGWHCEEKGCKRRFKSAGALENHVALKHSDLPPASPIASTSKLSTSTTTSTSKSKSKSTSKLTDLPNTNSTLLDFITGIDYISTRSQHPNGLSGDNNTSKSKVSRKFKCPYPLVLEIGERLDPDEILEDEDDDDVDDMMQGNKGSGASCLYRFKRVYDVERHLRSFHGVVVDTEILEGYMGEGEVELIF